MEENKSENKNNNQTLDIKLRSLLVVLIVATLVIWTAAAISESVEKVKLKEYKEMRDNKAYNIVEDK